MPVRGWCPRRPTTSRSTASAAFSSSVAGWPSTTTFLAATAGLVLSASETSSSNVRSWACCMPAVSGGTMSVLLMGTGLLQADSGSCQTITAVKRALASSACRTAQRKASIDPWEPSTPTTNCSQVKVGLVVSRPSNDCVAEPFDTKPGCGRGGAFGSPSSPEHDWPSVEHCLRPRSWDRRLGRGVFCFAGFGRCTAAAQQEVASRYREHQQRRPIVEA